MTSWHKICCAIDLSACSEDALRASATLARQQEIPLVLFHAWGQADATASEVLFSQPELRDAELREERALLEGWQRQAAALREAPVELVIERTRHPAESIAAFAQRTGCDLVVVGTHGRRGIGRVVLGSVAERVTRLARCSVLVVRPEQLAEERGAAAT